MRQQSFAGRLRDRARRIKRDAIALWLAARDPRVPCHAKLLAALVAAYALSPIDLIPDFLPIIGYLDDVLIVPLGILLVVKMIPPSIMAELRARAATRSRPVSKGGVVIVIALWVAALLLLLWWWFSWGLSGSD